MTIIELIEMKKERNIPYGTQYRWLLETIENDLRSKANGDEWVQDLLSDYDETAKLFIIHQFIHLGKSKLANELFSVLGIDSENTSLEDKYIRELVDSTSQL